MLLRLARDLTGVATVLCGDINLPDGGQPSPIDEGWPNTDDDRHRVGNGGGELSANLSQLFDEAHSSTTPPQTPASIQQSQPEPELVPCPEPQPEPNLKRMPRISLSPEANDSDDSEGFQSAEEWTPEPAPAPRASERQEVGSVVDVGREEYTQRESDSSAEEEEAVRAHEMSLELNRLREALGREQSARLAQEELLADSMAEPTVSPELVDRYFEHMLVGMGIKPDSAAAADMRRQSTGEKWDMVLVQRLAASVVRGDPHETDVSRSPVSENDTDVWSRETSSGELRAL